MGFRGRAGVPPNLRAQGIASVCSRLVSSSGSGVDVHQPFLLAWTHPSKAPRPQYSLKFLLEAELSGPLFPFLIKAVKQKKAFLTLL